MVRFNQYAQLFKRLVISVACLAMVSLTVFGSWTPSATAATVGAEKAAAVMNDRAAAELDRMAGQGTSDQLEGALQGGLGKAKRDIGRVSDDFGDQLEGAADQLTGKVKRDIGRTKSEAADFGDDVDEKASGIVESVKDFFD